jgi:hypothetical protein
MHMFSFYKSYYVGDTAFILLSRGELVAASKLFVSPFRHFGLTIHTGGKRKGEGSKTEAIYFPRPGQESSAADMEDIEIDEDRFMSFCLKCKYLGSDFVETELDKVGKTLTKKLSTPMTSGYRPEVDVSPELNDEQAKCFQNLIGVLRWSVELGRIDIHLEVAQLSSHLALPREGHLEQAFHIFAYLKKHDKSKVVFDDSMIDWNKKGRFHPVD